MTSSSWPMRNGSSIEPGAKPSSDANGTYAIAATATIHGTTTYRRCAAEPSRSVIGSRRPLPATARAWQRDRVDGVSGGA
jgi:hypothetical protein